MRNIFLLYGNDEFAIARKIKDFEADFSDPTSAGMNTARLEARTMSEDELGNAVNAMPFLAKRRLVLLSNPSAKYNNPPARKKFLEFIEKTPDSARLVIHEIVDPKEAEKHWLVKWAEKHVGFRPTVQDDFWDLHISLTKIGANSRKVRAMSVLWDGT